MVDLVNTFRLNGGSCCFLLLNRICCWIQIYKNKCIIIKISLIYSFSKREKSGKHFIMQHNLVPRLILLFHILSYSTYVYTFIQSLCWYMIMFIVLLFCRRTLIISETLSVFKTIFFHNLKTLQNNMFEKKRFYRYNF